MNKPRNNLKLNKISESIVRRVTERKELTLDQIKSNLKKNIEENTIFEILTNLLEKKVLICEPRYKNGEIIPVYLVGIAQDNVLKENGETSTPRALFGFSSDELIQVFEKFNKEIPIVAKHYGLGSTWVKNRLWKYIAQTNRTELEDFLEGRILSLLYENPEYKFSFEQIGREVLSRRSLDGISNWVENLKNILLKLINNHIIKEKKGLFSLNTRSLKVSLPIPVGNRNFIVWKVDNALLDNIIKMSQNHYEGYVITPKFAITPLTTSDYIENCVYFIGEPQLLSYHPSRIFSQNTHLPEIPTDLPKFEFVVDPKLQEILNLPFDPALGGNLSTKNIVDLIKINWNPVKNPDHLFDYLEANKDVKYVYSHFENEFSSLEEFVRTILKRCFQMRHWSPSGILSFLGDYLDELIKNMNRSEPVEEIQSSLIDLISNSENIGEFSGIFLDSLPINSFLAVVIPTNSKEMREKIESLNFQGLFLDKLDAKHISVGHRSKNSNFSQHQCKNHSVSAIIGNDEIAESTSHRIVRENTVESNQKNVPDPNDLVRTFQNQDVQDNISRKPLAENIPGIVKQKNEIDKVISEWNYLCGYPKFFEDIKLEIFPLDYLEEKYWPDTVGGSIRTNLGTLRIQLPKNRFQLSHSVLVNSLLSLIFDHLDSYGHEIVLYLYEKIGFDTKCFPDFQSTINEKDFFIGILSMFFDLWRKNNMDMELLSFIDNIYKFLLDEPHQEFYKSVFLQYLKTREDIAFYVDKFFSLILNIKHYLSPESNLYPPLSSFNSPYQDVEYFLLGSPEMSIQFSGVDHATKINIPGFSVKETYIETVWEEIDDNQGNIYRIGTQKEFPNGTIEYFLNSVQEIENQGFSLTILPNEITPASMIKNIVFPPSFAAEMKPFLNKKLPILNEALKEALNLLPERTIKPWIYLIFRDQGPIVDVSKDWGENGQEFAIIFLDIKRIKKANILDFILRSIFQIIYSRLITNRLSRIEYIFSRIREFPSCLPNQSMTLNPREYFVNALMNFYRKYDTGKEEHYSAHNFDGFLKRVSARIRSTSIDAAYTTNWIESIKNRFRDNPTNKLYFESFIKTFAYLRESQVRNSNILDSIYWSNKIGRILKSRTVIDEKKFPFYSRILEILGKDYSEAAKYIPILKLGYRYIEHLEYQMLEQERMSGIGAIRESKQIKEFDQNLAFYDDPTIDYFFLAPKDRIPIYCKDGIRKGDNNFASFLKQAKEKGQFLFEFNQSLLNKAKGPLIVPKYQMEKIYGDILRELNMSTDIAVFGIQNAYFDNIEIPKEIDPGFILFNESIPQEFLVLIVDWEENLNPGNTSLSR